MNRLFTLQSRWGKQNWHVSNVMAVGLALVGWMPFSSWGAWVPAPMERGAPKVEPLPASLTRFIGQPLVFRPGITAETPYECQWFFNASPMPGETNGTLKFNHLRAGDAGHYWVRVSNSDGVAESGAAVLDVVPAPETPGAVDPGFKVALMWEDERVGSPRLWQQQDERLLVSGRFTHVNGDARTNLARLLPDGEVDPTFNFTLGAGEDGMLNAVLPLADGRIVVSGLMRSESGNTEYGLARLEENGAVDQSFAAEVESDLYVRALADDGQGNLLAGGRFGERQRVVRLGPNGAKDPTYTNDFGWFGGIEVLVVQRDGKVLVGGGFDQVNGEARKGLVRLNTDGTLDRTFEAAGVVAVDEIVVQPDGKLLVLGEFLDEPEDGRLVRLNWDGSVDTGFHTEAQEIHAVELQPDGKILIGGGFCSVGSERAGLLARLNTDGSLDPGFHASPGREACEDVAVETMILKASGDIVIGGSFHVLQGETLNGLARVSGGEANRPGSVDVTFDPLQGGRWIGKASTLEGSAAGVNALVVQPDGKIVIGGEFSGVNGAACMNYARVLSDGTPDPGFDSSWGADGAVSTMGLDSQGRILLGGQFTRINAVQRLGLARLNSDGSLDRQFEPPMNFARASWARIQLRVQPDDKILVSGPSEIGDYRWRYQLIRLNTDGSLDGTFTIDGTVFGTNGHISQILLQPDGRILVHGANNLPDAGPEYVVRFQADGRLDESFTPELPGSSGTRHIMRLALQQDGKILVAYGWSGQLLRWNTDGSIDPTFNRDTWLQASISDMAVLTNGKILVGGDFGTLQGVERRSVARLNADGTLDMSFDPGYASGGQGLYDWASVQALYPMADGRILVGAIASGTNTQRSCLFLLKADGPRDPELNTALFSGYGQAELMTALPGGKALVRGWFPSQEGTGRQVRRLNVDGSVDPSFDLGSLAEAELQLLTRYPDGRLLFGCALEYFEGGPRSVVRVSADGAFDPTFKPVSIESFYDERTIAGNAAVQPDGKIVVVGSFWKVNEVERHYIVRLNADGTLDGGFVPARLEIGDDWYLTGVEVQRDGKIVVTGHIFDIPWSTYYGIARLNPDGSLDTGFRARARLNGPVFRLALQEDDRILVGGEFTLANGVERPGLARLNADGTLDTSFNPPETYFDSPSTFAKTLALAPDSRILAATDKQVLRLNADGSLDSTFSAAVGKAGYVGGLIGRMSVSDTGDVLVGGEFAWVNGIPVRGIARLNGDVGGTAPAITLQPMNQIRLTGQTATFTVHATGTLPLVYEWLFNGEPIARGTNPVLVLRRVYPGDAGVYSVRVRNATGTAESEVATLRVQAPETAPGSVDWTFDPTAGGTQVGIGGDEGWVGTLVPVAGGRMIVGGQFQGINGRAAQNIARVFSDGTVDTTFDSSTGPNGGVRKAIAQPDGRIVICGAFTCVAGTERPGLARLHPDGTLDLDFIPHTRGSINAMALQEDRAIVIGGIFNTVDGQTRHNLARLHPNGTLDTSFDSGSAIGGLSGTVNDVTVQRDGKIVVAGYTSTQEAAQFVIRLNRDGSLDADFHADTSLWGWWCGATAVAIQADGGILVGGAQLARLYPDGSLDTQFNPDPSSAWLPYGCSINALEVRADGMFYAAGSFNSFRGAEACNIVLVNPNGTREPSFAPERQSALGEIGHIFGLAQPGDGSIVAGSGSLRGDVTRCLVKFRYDGERDMHFTARINPSGANIRKIAVQTNGQIVIGGTLTSVNGQARHHLARLEADGTLDETFEPQTPTDGLLTCMAVEEGGKVIAGFYWDSDRSEVVRFNRDGSRDTGFNSPFGTGDKVYSMLRLADGSLYVGGWFSVQDRSCLVRLNPDGTVDETFTAQGLSAGDDFGVATIAELPGGDILIGGEISAMAPDGTSSGQGLLRYHPDGSQDLAFNERVSTMALIRDIVVEPDGMILIHAHSGLLQRLNADGSNDEGFQTPDVGFGPMALQGNGKILLGDSSRVIRLNNDGSLDATFSATVFPNQVSALSIQGDGQLLVGGGFWRINDIACEGLARLILEPATVVVTRELWQGGLTASGIPVRLIVTPAPQVAVYAVEDRPPQGWTVTGISPGGTWDAINGEVKFGPFYDTAPRTLTYEAVPPPGSQGMFAFAGVVSVDGMDRAIEGDETIDLPGYHPADASPGDWMLAIAEVTAYGAAWRKGNVWPTPPNPIPIDFVTRAGALWRGGEHYEITSKGEPAPLCWVNCAASASPGAAAQPGTDALQGVGSAATRELAHAYVPGEPVQITIAAAPGAGADAFAIEDQPPLGWGVSSISDGGEMDAVNRKVKWGPFLDGTPRTLSYRATPPLGATGMATLTGTASFGGTRMTIGGGNSLSASCRVSVQRVGTTGRIRLNLGGELGARYQIEASTDLKSWTPVGVVTSSGDGIEIEDSETGEFRQRFYRAMREK